VSARLRQATSSVPRRTVQPFLTSDYHRNHRSTVVPSKYCSLDPLPTWIIKQLKHVFAPIVCALCNSSLSNGVLPASQKHAIVLPRLKKPGLDPTNQSSYSISNLIFLSKLVERVVTARFIIKLRRTNCFHTVSRLTAEVSPPRQPYAVSRTI